MLRWLSTVAGIAMAATLSGCQPSTTGDEPPSQRTSGGPLAQPNVHAWGHHAAPGEPFTDGTEVLLLRGDERAVVESVELVGDERIELVGAKLVKPGREWGSIGQLPWPPRDQDLDQSLVVEATGTTVTPQTVDGQGFELLLGMRVDADMDRDEARGDS